MSTLENPTPPLAAPWRPTQPADARGHERAGNGALRRQARVERACEGLRRIAAPWLAGGATLAQAARTLGMSPGRLAAAHAAVFDPAQSPLKARRLAMPVQALRAALAAQAPLQWQPPGQQAGAQPGHPAGQQLTLHGAALSLHTAPGLQAYAVQTADAAPQWMWFNRAGDVEWVWAPHERQQPLLASWVSRWGSVDLRASLPAPGDVGLAPGVPPRPATGLPSGAAWDLLLHAAALGLPLAVQAGAAATLTWQGRLQRVQLDRQRLRVEADGLRLSLHESAPVFLADASPSMRVDAGLRLGVAPETGRSHACAWQRVVDAAVHGDRPVMAGAC